MATVSDIISLAFRKIGVKAEDEALTADQLSHGLDTLIMMLNAWGISGIDASGVGLTTGDPFPLEAAMEQATVYCLAARLAPDYGAVAPDVREHERTLRNYLASRDAVQTPLVLTRMPSRYRRYGLI